MLLLSSDYLELEADGPSLVFILAICNDFPDKLNATINTIDPEQMFNCIDGNRVMSASCVLKNLVSCGKLLQKRLH